LTSEGDYMAQARSDGLIGALNDASLNRFHLRAVLVSGMGFFTDAYDLFIIGVASTLIKQDWHLDTGKLALLNATMLGAACLGAMCFGRIADLIGRKRVYWLVAAVMAVASIGSALAPSFWVLIGFRFMLGIGVGGDYPVSAVLMTEYANRKDRGRLVGLVFSTQALGLIVGPLIALGLLGAGTSTDLTWRLLLAIGAIPASAVVYLRSRMPESPRFQVQVLGHQQTASQQLGQFSDGVIGATSADTSGADDHPGDADAGLADLGLAAPGLAELGLPAMTGPGPSRRIGLREFLTTRRYLVLLSGTAGCWFLLDYAYYGNTISTPQIIKLISPTASTMQTIAIQLAIFVVAAVPGYILGIARIDKIGHRRLQLVGFSMMALCFIVIGVVPGLTTVVLPFLTVYGISYFFTEFGPNMTTFVLPGELFPVSMRATAHGISAGIGKFGAFIGVFLFPVLQEHLGLRLTLLLAGFISVAGALLTLVLPEPSGRSLEEISAPDGALADVVQLPRTQPEAKIAEG
jgi:PHS family inorganic phosphate transporter-like MFS transporter